eukprot:5422640-Prymnesium_polylepis.1
MPWTTTALRLRRRWPTTPVRARLEARRACPAARQRRFRAPCRPRPRPRPPVRRLAQISAQHARQSNRTRRRAAEIARVRVSGSAPPLRDRAAPEGRKSAHRRNAQNLLEDARLPQGGCEQVGHGARTDATMWR